MDQSIIENLKEFYLDAAVAQGIAKGETHGLSWFFNKTGHWPNVLLGQPTSNNIEQINSQIEKNTLPPFWLCENSPNNNSLLTENVFREVSRWEGMWLKPDNFIQNSINNKTLIIKEVNTAQALNEWINVAFSVLMPTKTIDRSITLNWLKSEKYTLLTGYINEQAVSTALSFTHQTIAGLYFITTLPEQQKKGLASILVSQLIEHCFENKVQKIILHASSAGLPLYQKLGFQANGQLSTFWKVGIL